MFQKTEFVGKTPSDFKKKTKKRYDGVHVGSYKRSANKRLHICLLHDFLIVNIYIVHRNDEVDLIQ